MPTIRNGLLHGREVADLHFSDGLIVDEPADNHTIDLDGHIVSPGFVDIQINGGFGFDFTQDPRTIWAVGSRLPELGVTSFVPTVVTSPAEVTDLAIEVVTRRKPDDYAGADVLGLHFEGPWISDEMHGAHNPDHIVDPDPDTARKWAESGVVRIVTLAPEMPGAEEVGALLAQGGVFVSIGHTNATYDVACAALSHYARLSTHLFNQMSPLHHRDPGAVGAALLSDKPAILIVDGLHIADGAVELAWRLLGPDRTVLVTDAMAALGLGPGTYPLGDGPITVGDDGPRTTDGRLAGSVVTVAGAARNLMKATGATATQALAAATLNPLRALGVEDRGRLRAGQRADLVFLDQAFGIVGSVLNGQVVGR